MAAWTVLFDADCGLCRWSAERLRRWDRASRLRFVALGTPEADALLRELTPAERTASWHLVGPDGRVTSGGSAVPAVLTLLPGGRPLSAVAARFPGATDRAYRLVADHRDRIGAWLGRGACDVDPSVPRRRRLRRASTRHDERPRSGRTRGATAPRGSGGRRTSR